MPGFGKEGHELAIQEVVLLVKGREKQAGLGELGRLSWTVLSISMELLDLSPGWGRPYRIGSELRKSGLCRGSSGRCLSMINLHVKKYSFSRWKNVIKL